MLWSYWSDCQNNVRFVSLDCAIEALGTRSLCGFDCKGMDELGTVASTLLNRDCVAVLGSDLSVSSSSVQSESHSASDSVSSLVSLRRITPKRPAPPIPVKSSCIGDSLDKKVVSTLEKMPVSHEEFILGPNGWNTFSVLSDDKGVKHSDVNIAGGPQNSTRSQSVPESTLAAQLPPASVIHSYYPSSPLSISTHSQIYSSLQPVSHPSNYGSFFMTSVPGSEQSKFVALSESPQVGQMEYLAGTPLVFVPQIPTKTSVVQNPCIPNPELGNPFLYKQSVPQNILTHSTSDPGIYETRTYLPIPTITSLDRLSEKDEDEDIYEDVFIDEDPKENKQLVPSGNDKTTKGRMRPERSDSVSLPHLYDDFVISSRLNLRVTFTNLTVVVVLLALLLPNSATVLYSFFRLIFGTLFPAYYSYKAVRTKNIKEYVKWMMYWIVFAFFTCAETITDVFVSFWFPFYYEIKILVVLWLLSPATRGSSILYRKFVHPWLTQKEDEIDECIAKAKQQGYSTFVELGTKGVNYATNVIMQTALKGGGGLVSHLKRSYSTSEIGEDTADHNRNLRALPIKDTIQTASEDEDMDLSTDSFGYESRHRTHSESSSGRNRAAATTRRTRTAKTKSVDISDVDIMDVTDTFPASVIRRRSPRIHNLGRTESTTQLNETRRSRSGATEVSNYATLPRASAKRGTVKKRQL